MPQSRFEPTSEFKKRRTNSGSTTSWEGYALSRPGVSSGGTDKRDDEDQPWGMPQEQYKALNPLDKKQVRNRIGARRFRAKRKGECAAVRRVCVGRTDPDPLHRNELS